MNRKSWVRLDNASNIFLAARSESDPKVFRLSAEMDHEVDPEVLQQALDLTFDRYPLYRAVLRRGVFWHYLQDSELRPTVSEETLHTCYPIYQPDQRTLLFRVTYYGPRIGLEVFHALSDGGGAIWFLSDLLADYVWLQSGEPGARPLENAQVVHELTSDSFAHYFRRSSEPWAPSASDSSGARGGTAAAEGDRVSDARAGRARVISVKKVHRVTGTRNPDNRTRVIELTTDSAEVLALAKAEGVSLTIYLIALFFESVRLSRGGLGRARTMAVSVPVNLRQQFPSTSARNFFVTVRLEYTYGEGDDSIGAICRELDRQFQPQITADVLDRKLRRLMSFERHPLLRVVPRGLKDLILRTINWANNRGLTVAVSNMGRLTLPEPAEGRVKRILLHVSAARPQFCNVSHNGLLTISFTSPFVETDHVREFVRLLTEQGAAVQVAAARVTEHELAEVEPA